MTLMLGEMSMSFMQKLAQKGLTIEDLKNNPSILQAITETRALDRPEPITALVPNIAEAKAGTVRAVAAPTYIKQPVAQPIPWQPAPVSPYAPPGIPSPAPGVPGISGAMDWIKSNLMLLALGGIAIVLIAKRGK